MSQISPDRVEPREPLAELTASESHELLANDRRRLILDILDGGTAPIDLDELAVEVATHEDGADPADEKTLQQLRTRLHHNHLPKMDEFGALEYDPVSHCLRL
jgi:hypothetical protein